MIILFIVILNSHLEYLVLLVFRVLVNLDPNENSKLAKIHSLEKVDHFCKHKRTSLKTYLIALSVQYFFNQLNFIQIIIAFVILKKKSSDDILQGINKIDYLIKVSVFQVYKDASS